MYKSETFISMPTSGWEVNVKPVSPGEILQEEFLKPFRMSQSQLAKILSCDVKTINKICNGRSSITARTALGFAKVFGTSPEFWLQLQIATDLWAERNREEKIA
ncbi:addiction module antidote protein, HigA family [Silvanigrella aquatica]|uniref:Addiction module antidote protein, HigA family n=2 Tax=Silvanigrella aquatica TaxID=1915309 RepID=A0A1L4D4D0_9BACT|nr:addiction module antidote protein, HigA family [Silvanigrella aquatica]